jgi:predicted TIM-barrel fold metal-dependent hydrolase
MQNIHTHTWDYKLHNDVSVYKESVLARGYEIDLTVTFDKFIKDMEPFEKVVVFGLKTKLTGTWVPDKYVADFITKAPDKLRGFASCDPTQKEYIEELKFALEDLKLSGVKMGPGYAGFDPRDPRCDVVYKYCQENGFPILFHTGTMYKQKSVLEFSRPWIYDEIGRKYPDLKIVLAHVGHPWCQECLAVIRKNPNMYTDIAALYYRPWQFYNLMMIAQEYKVIHKILFGTDYPITDSIEHINGVKNVNRIIGNSGLPKVSARAIEEILERDSFSLLGIK